MIVQWILRSMTVKWILKIKILNISLLNLSISNGRAQQIIFENSKIEERFEDKQFENRVAPIRIVNETYFEMITNPRQPTPMSSIWLLCIKSIQKIHIVCAGINSSFLFHQTTYKHQKKKIFHSHVSSEVDSLHLQFQLIYNLIRFNFIFFMEYQI